MSEIKIFLASSAELKEDRDQFHLFVSRENEDWRKRGVFLRVVRWENFRDAMLAEGLQSGYNEAVESCDIFVMLVHNKVGKYTAEEFERALNQFSKTGSPLIYTYFKKPITTDDWRELRSLSEFGERLESLGHFKTNYSSIDGLENHFGKQLEKLADEGFIQAEAKVEPSQPEGLMAQYRVPLQMPPLPDHFVERPEPQDAVKGQLLCEDKVGTLVVSAIYGLGGIGKSVLAAKLAHDPAVREYFADGILWATLGQNPDILPLLSGWIQALGDHDYKPTAVESASNHLRTLLYDKCMLLVVDDVWNPVHLEPFRVGGDKGRVLVTTREARIEGTRLHSLDVMDEGQALALMTQKISAPLSEDARARAVAFAGRVGYLPLALELAASQIEDGVSWAELLADFTTELARLESLDVYGRGEIPDDEKRRKYSLLACFNLSLKQLSGEQLRQFAWLGVVPEDVSLTQEMVETLWGVTARQAGAILRVFRAKSLVLQGVKQSGERPSYRMHDLMHDLARKLLQLPVEPEQVGELPGLGLTVAAAHSELLRRYQAKTSEGLWHTLKDDGYIFAHLTWHMERAGQARAIHTLLRASNVRGRNGWYEACDAIGKPAGFVNDLGRGWVLAKENYEAAPGETVALLFHYGLMRGSLNSLASKIPAEMLGGLVKEGYWQAAQGLAYAQQAQNPWQRAKCISAIAPYMPEALLPEVLKAVGQIKDAAYRSYVLSKLAEHFPKIWPDALVAIQQIEDRYGNHRDETEGFACKAFAISKVVPQLPVRYLAIATEISRQIQDTTDCATAMVAMAQYLPDLWPEALETTRKIEDEYWRASTLIEIAQADVELWPEALKTIREIQDEYYCSFALSAIAQHLPKNLWPEALKTIREIQDEYYCSFALSAMAQHLPGLWTEVLTIIRSLRDESNRADVICAMAQHLPKSLWPEVIQITREMKDEPYQPYRSDVICAIARCLPKSLWPEVIEIIREIESEPYRADSIRAIVQHLPKDLLPEALKITYGIETVSCQLNAICAVAHCLPALWVEAFEVTRQINDKVAWSHALRRMAHYHHELWFEALEVIRRMEDDFSQEYALRKIAPHLSESLWPKALEITRNIESEPYRLITLRGIIPHLPESLWPKALEIIRKGKAKYYQSSTLCQMARHSPELRSEALEIARSIKDESSRFLALFEVAQHLPELWFETIETARSIKNISSRGAALSTLAQHFPELWPNAIEIARELKDESSKVFALREMVQYIPKKQWPEALAIARELKNESSSSFALREMAHYMPEEQWPEVLEIVRGLKDAYYCLNALSAIAQHLPEVWTEVLGMARELKDEFSRSDALKKMVQYLPKAQWPEALSITKKLKDESSRSQTLSTIAQHLPPKHLPEALEIAWSIQDKYYCAQALQGFLSSLEQLAIPFPEWARILDVIAYQNRSELLKALPASRLTIMRLGDDETLPAILQAVRDVCKQWP